MSTLDDKVILITGASRGVGRATARRLAGAGASVALLARSPDDLQQVVDEINAATGRKAALAVPADLADEMATRQAVAATVARFGGLDVLVNNAGIGRYGPTESYDLADWRATLDINLTGAFVCSQAALPHLKARGGGAIISIASGAARQGYPNMVAYCASKFGLRGLMEALAAEFSDDNIRCSTIYPGGILTDFGPRGTAEKRAGGGKYLRPEDIADAILFLLTQPSSAWTQEMTLWPFSRPE